MQVFEQQLDTTAQAQSMTDEVCRLRWINTIHTIA